MSHDEALSLKSSDGLAALRLGHNQVNRGRGRRKYIPNLLQLLGISLLVLGGILFTSYTFTPYFPNTVLSLFTDKISHPHGSRTQTLRQKAQELCPLVEPIFPDVDNPGLRHAHSRLHSPGYLLWSAKALGDAVRVKTQVYDEFGDVDEDKRWNRMEPFLRYLRKTFPLIHEQLNLERVNTYGLLYTWEGSDPDEKPILLLAHQDVVPIEPETLSEWEHPPFSGDFDGTFVWGRGSLDDKNQLVAIMEAVELLLYGGFWPRRTVILGFGFDEEVGGFQGASHLAERLTSRYGSNGIGLIIDEGSSMITEFGSNIMVISTAEKGFVNQQITIKAPGGHSSVPPRHTSIGIMSEIIVAIESHPFAREFSDDNPLYDFLTCVAAHAKDFPEELYDYIEQGDKKALADGIVKWNPRYDADLRTTIAVTTIKGGTKVNALPEFVTVGINHRIRRGSSISEVKRATTKLASDIAKKYNLDLIDYGEKRGHYPESSITLEIGYQREPSPLTSSRTDILTPFKLIAGTSRAMFGEDVIVTASLNMGNTDTFWYTNLSENIFRYAPMPVVKKNMHGVNEHVPMKGHLAMVEWVFSFLINMNSVDDAMW